MHRFALFLALLGASTLAFACSSTSSNPSSDNDDDPSPTEPEPKKKDKDSDKPDTDTKPKDAEPTKIGTLDDKGVDRVDVNLSSHGSYTCESTCTKAGGKCVFGANGAGWVDRKYDDGDTFGNQITSCTDSESYSSGTATLTEMYCYCDGLDVPPTVRVKKSEGVFSCSKVCKSWSLTCSESRRHYAYKSEEETSGVTTIDDCDTAPPATSHHYVCACDAAKE